MRVFLAMLFVSAGLIVVFAPSAAATCEGPADAMCDAGYPDEVCALYVDDPVFNGICFPIPCIKLNAYRCDWGG